MTSNEVQPTPSTESSAESEGYDVLVIGAGQAGLTVGYYLKQAGLRFLIVDAADRVGSAWRQRWESLVLFTPRRYNAMPGLSFDGDPDQEPTRDEVIEYLDRYARELDLPVEPHSRVVALDHHQGRYAAELEARTILADQVVVATGPFQQPWIPSFAASSPRTSIRLTAPATADRATFRRDGLSSSGAVTPAIRSPRNWPPTIRSYSRWAHDRRRYHNVCSAGNCSGGSPRSACNGSRSNRALADGSANAMR